MCAREKGTLTKEKKLSYLIFTGVSFFSPCADGAWRSDLIYHLVLAPSSSIGRARKKAALIKKKPP